MTQAELLPYVVETLEELEIPYMIGGSQAAVYYGEPRFTRDVDFVVGLGLAEIPALLTRFPAPDFYVSGEAAREAVEARGQFNIIHPASGLKIDIFVNRDTPYDRLWSSVADACRSFQGGMRGSRAPTRATSPSGPNGSGSVPSGTRCSSERDRNDAGPAGRWAMS